MGICLIKGQWLWLLYVLLIHIVIVINNIEAISPDGMITDLGYKSDSDLITFHIYAIVMFFFLL